MLLLVLNSVCRPSCHDLVENVYYFCLGIQGNFFSLSVSFVSFCLCLSPFFHLSVSPLCVGVSLSLSSFCLYLSLSSVCLCHCLSLSSVCASLLSLSVSSLYLFLCLCLLSLPVSSLCLLSLSLYVWLSHLCLCCISLPPPTSTTTTTTSLSLPYLSLSLSPSVSLSLCVQIQTSMTTKDTTNSFSSPIFQPVVMWTEMNDNIVKQFFCLRAACRCADVEVFRWPPQVDQYLIVGGMGGRLDHHFANVATLFKAAPLTARPVYLISHGNLACLLPRVSIGSVCILSHHVCGLFLCLLMIAYMSLFSALLGRLAALPCGSTWVTSSL